MKQIKRAGAMFKYLKQPAIHMQNMLKIGLVMIVFVAGCYSDRLPEEIDHLGVPRVSALAVEAIPLVTLRPTETVKVPLRINRNNNEGPIDVSLSKLPSGVEATFEKQIPQGKSELEIELSGNQSLGDRQRNVTVTIALSMAQSSVEQPFDIDLPVVSRPSFGACHLSFCSLEILSTCECLLKEMDLQNHSRWSRSNMRKEHCVVCQVSQSKTIISRFW
jgi:hypothetical protein